MRLKVFQKGFNYSQDGDGNRLVYHLQGCNMHCPWCANPEGISLDGTLIVNGDKLIESVCPYGAIASKTLNRSICKSCNTRECTVSNKNVGVQLSYEDYELTSLLEEVKSSSTLFFDGGGVTLSGGEPTLQFAAVYEFLHDLKELGIHTAIETNATHPKLEELFPYIDLLIMDFKHYDNDTHSKITGISNTTIKQNIEKALSSHKRVHIRTPIVNGINAEEDDVKNFIAFYKQFETRNTTFEFLQYHEYGKVKWKQCGMDYEMKDAFVSSETIKLYKTMFREKGLNVIST